MMRSRRACVSLALALCVAALASACGGGGDGAKSPTAAPSSAPTTARTVAATPTSALDLRDVDLSKVADVTALIAASGGQFLQSSVIYADLTEDGVDEAVVPINSGGTLGDIAFLVLSASGGTTKTLLKETPQGQAAGLSVTVEGGQLVMTQPVYGPEDPNCCPSSLKKTTYVWNGSTLAVQSVKTEANPAGGGKTTPAPSPEP